MKVYRIENSEGKGPYINRGVHNRSDTPDNHLDDNHPGPEQDKGLKGIYRNMGHNESSKFIFGFKSVTQLEAWFTNKEIENLYELGYQIKQIEAKEVIQGDKQIMFKRLNVRL